MIRVAAVQVAPVFLDLAKSLDRLEEWTAKAAATGARLVVFGETWLPGYPAWLDSCPEAALWAHPGAKALYTRLTQNAVEIPGAAFDRLARIAREAGVVLAVGAHERAGRSLYCSLLVLGPDGTLLNRHRKLKPTYGERLVWGDGDAAGLRVVDTPVGRVGGLVCWEHWLPLARQALHDGQEQIHIALWPGVQEMHQVASRHYAFEGRCFVIAAGSLLRRADMPTELPVASKYDGPPEQLMIPGGSAIIGPNGKYLAGPVYETEAIVSADLDLDLITGESLTLDVSGHYSRPDLFEFKVRTTA
ncbi:MAG TPA: carbon-nitrogen hydrolase family protein [Gemmatimonadales bacterium]|nr:carbon-nitrogen hydrolase family protein [Gemmatimonadales bacterium]